MEKEDILKTLSKVISNVLNVNDLELNYNMSAKDIDGWTSLTNMQIISEIEKEFNIRFKLRDIIKMHSLDDMCNEIKNKLQQ
ncbi:MAG: acyl carrier protein [Phocaeicola sp.]|uniref:acyl carrier protein n=1 Tax=Phocaeicola TaxID=909656 RepID=UPI00234F4502|nr:acyl carrier protein [Phocaeicola oris]MCE2617046.1 acyl carrier protein [Phocaeicola oris]